MIKVSQTELPVAALFMKVGYHVNEDLDEIILRKQKEEKACGVFYWGYGGNLCHPTRQVIPFAKNIINEETLWLMMSITTSRFETTPNKATEFSCDGESWQSLPNQAVITGSRYALVCRKLERVNLLVNLSQYGVAVGPSKDRPISKYLRSRVDKACALRQPNVEDTENYLPISFCAQIVYPFAIFVR